MNITYNLRKINLISFSSYYRNNLSINTYIILYLIKLYYYSNFSLEQYYRHPYNITIYLIPLIDVFVSLFLSLSYHISSLLPISYFIFFSLGTQTWLGPHHFKDRSFSFMRETSFSTASSKVAAQIAPPRRACLFIYLNET